jgi:hypothetical protein
MKVVSQVFQACPGQNPSWLEVKTNPRYDQGGWIHRPGLDTSDVGGYGLQSASKAVPNAVHFHSHMLGRSNSSGPPADLQPSLWPRGWSSTYVACEPWQPSAVAATCMRVSWRTRALEARMGSSSLGRLERAVPSGRKALLALHTHLGLNHFPCKRCRWLLPGVWPAS